MAAASSSSSTDVSASSSTSLVLTEAGLMSDATANTWCAASSIKTKTKPGDRSILVLYMGGTLGMKPNHEGALEPAAGYLQERMLGMSEFSQSEMPAVTLIEHDPLLDSSDMGPPEWQAIVKAVDKYYYDYDGFVVIMGTDTMAYASTAASFMIENLGKPIVFTGSMVPLCELYNDAKRNLIVACIIAGYIDVPEVCLFINSELYRGSRVTKVDSHGLDAFSSPNYQPLVTLATGFRANVGLFRPQPRGRFRVETDICQDVAVLRMVPGFSDDYIDAVIAHTPSLKGMVLQLYGTGNAGQRKGSFMKSIQAAIARNIVVVAATQCAKGGVSLETYVLGRKLLEAGVVSSGDMTTEATATKLGWLLARPGTSVERVRRLLRRDLRGELTESGEFMASHGTAVSRIIEDHSVAHLHGSASLQSIADMRASRASAADGGRASKL